MKKPKNYLFHRDVIISIAFTYFLIWLLSFVFINTKYLNPFYQALKDFQFTDLYYSLYNKNPSTINEDIIIINIGKEDRAGIARLLEDIKGFKPKVIGLDVCFLDKKDSESDAVLKTTLHGEVPVILASQIQYNAENKALPVIQKSNGYFGMDANEGYGALLSGAGKTIRYYQPFIKINKDSLYPSFTSRIASIYNPEAFRMLEKRGNKSEYINYTNSKFITLDTDSIYPGNPQLQILSDKIVLMGFINLSDEVIATEDMHLTPLNKSYGGRAVPDMHGVQIHAHILNMVLSQRYIKEPSGIVLGTLALLLTLLHMYPFLYYFVKKHIWFHLVAKTIQLISFLVIFISSIFIYHYFRIRLEPALLIYAVILSVDSLYFLDGIAKFLYQKFNFHSYFIENH